MDKPSDYKYIYVWGKMMGCQRQIIFHTQVVAFVKGAPINAVDRMTCGEWLTTDMLGKSIRHTFNKACREYGIQEPVYADEGQEGNPNERA